MKYLDTVTPFNTFAPSASKVGNIGNNWIPFVCLSITLCLGAVERYFKVQCKYISISL